jgi:serine/threonine-protein kinase
MKFCDQCHATYPTDFTICPKDHSPLRLATDLVRGMILRDKYEIVEKIGSGGMATVYRARHLAFNEIRAIKVVSSRMMEDENFLKRFRNEAVITRKLQHPNAVRVDDIDTLEDGRPYIVMELVEGSSLRALIEQAGPLPAARALEITRQAGAALAAAHRLGIVHRDVKPDNIVIMRQADGRDLVKVLDFGIAKLREAGGSLYTATQTGMVIGTPQYISPEQAAGKKADELDGRADLYSLGVALYEMLTGQLPFHADTPMGFLMQHLQAEVPPPREVRPDLNIPDSASRLLAKLLEKDPDKRFQTAEEMIAAIEDPQALAAKPTQKASVSTTRVSVSPAAKTVAASGAAAATARATMPARAAKPASSGGAGKWVAIAVVIAAVALGGYYAAGRRSARARAESRVVKAERPAKRTEPSPSRTEAAVPAAIKTEEASAPRTDNRVRELLASARKYIDDGEYDPAIRDLQKALAIEPGNKAAENELKRAERAKRTEQNVLGKH